MDCNEKNVKSFCYVTLRSLSSDDDNATSRYFELFVPSTELPLN